MAVICIVFLICAFRVNICFVMIFFTLFLALVFLTATYWLLAADYEGNAAMAGKMLKVNRVPASQHVSVQSIGGRYGSGHVTD